MPNFDPQIAFVPRCDRLRSVPKPWLLCFCSMVEKYGIEESAVMSLICACCVPCSYFQMIFEVLSMSAR